MFLNSETLLVRLELKTEVQSEDGCRWQLKEAEKSRRGGSSTSLRLLHGDFAS